MADQCCPRFGQPVNRSMGLDTECNVFVEAAGDPDVYRAIAGLRDRLFGEHLGHEAKEVSAAVERYGSLIRAVGNAARRRAQTRGSRPRPGGLPGRATFRRSGAGPRAAHRLERPRRGLLCAPDRPPAAGFSREAQRLLRSASSMSAEHPARQAGVGIPVPPLSTISPRLGKISTRSSWATTRTATRVPG